MQAKKMEAAEMTIVSGTPARMYACHSRRNVEIDLAGQPQAADEQPDEDDPGENDGRPEAEPLPSAPARDLVDDRVHGALDAAGFERGRDGPALADAQRGILPLMCGEGVALTPPPCQVRTISRPASRSDPCRTTSRTWP